jgi:hypothetical protein
MDWLPMLQNFGFPAVACGAFGWGVWQVVRWIGQRIVNCLEAFGPKVTCIVDKHLLLLDTATEAQREIVSALHGAKSDIRGIKTDTETILERMKEHQ